MTSIEKDDFIVVDPGKHEVKVIVFTKIGTIKGVFAFPSISKKVRSFNNNESSSSKQFRLNLDKRNYLVGEGVSGVFNTDISKINEHHQLCVYASVAALVGDAKEAINLVIGSPTNDFELAESVDSYKELILGNNGNDNKDGAIELECNDLAKSFHIESLEVFPEGMAVLPRAISKKAGRIHVVDIGGQNVNYRLYDEKGNTINYFSLDSAGMNKLENFLKIELGLSMINKAIDFDSIDWNRAISEGKIQEIDDMIKEGTSQELVGFDDTAEFILDRVEDFIDREIVIPFSQRGIQLHDRGHAILFTGGGSLRLQTHLKEFFSDNWDNMEISQTAKWDNCISYAMRYLSKNASDKSVVTKAVVAIIKEMKHPDFEEIHDLFKVEEAVIG